METNSKPQEKEKNLSPNSKESSTASMNSSTTNNTTTNNGGLLHQIQTTPPLTPKLTPRSDPQTNPYPTTFVQADTSTFKQVVQMLTGSSEPSKLQSPSPPSSSSSKHNNTQDFLSNKNSIPPIKTVPKKQQSFKLYERRNQLIKNKLMINPLGEKMFKNSSNSFSPRNKPEILSPSLLDFPHKLVLSPVTPLTEDTFNNKSCNYSSEEDKAIAEKGFFLHPSPISTPRESEPQLLPLFPVTSPRVSGSSS